jgi:hypothetical protein
MDDIADLVGKEKKKKYFYGFHNIIGEFMVKEKGLMEQRKLENEATADLTFKLIELCIGLTIEINIGLEWVIDNGIANLIITIKTTMKPLVGGDKIIKTESQ